MPNFVIFVVWSALIVSVWVVVVVYSKNFCLGPGVFLVLFNDRDAGKVQDLIF